MNDQYELTRFGQSVTDKIFVDDYIAVRWSPQLKPYYTALGYEFTAMGDDLTILVRDLKPSSLEMVRIQCPICHDIRYARYGMVTESRSTTCRSCSGAFDLHGLRFGRLTAIDINRTSKGTYWDCVCDCGNTATVFARNLFDLHTQSCGCLQVDRVREAMTGSSNHQYNPDLSEEDRLSRREYPQYAEWRTAVYEQDGYECVICGSTGNLEAHHLNSYSTHQDDQTDPANGITLCVPHHRQFHKWMGGTRISCCEQDFYDWLDTLR